MAVDIPNYRVVEKLGVGAQSRIFRARCMRTGKDYTVKIVKVLKPEDASFVELLKNEYVIGSAVDHPALRKVYELRMIRHRLRVRGAILFMEYINGISLADKGFSRTLMEILHIFSEAAKGLDAMHLAGFVHADLKPNNIMVTTDDVVKLIDMGQSAKINEAKPRIQGTIDYIAPEQVERGILDRRTDVFGLGATLHRVLTGRAVRTGMNQTISMNAQGLVGRRIDDVPDEKEVELSPLIARFIEDCCQNDPDNRLCDMHKVLERIDLVVTTLKKRSQASASDTIQDDQDWSDEDDDIPGELGEDAKRGAADPEPTDPS